MGTVRIIGRLGPSYATLPLYTLALDQAPGSRSACTWRAARRWTTCSASTSRRPSACAWRTTA